MMPEWRFVKRKRYFFTDFRKNKERVIGSGQTNSRVETSCLCREPRDGITLNQFHRKVFDAPEVGGFDFPA